MSPQTPPGSGLGKSSQNVRRNFAEGTLDQCGTGQVKAAGLVDGVVADDSAEGHGRLGADADAVEGGVCELHSVGCAVLAGEPGQLGAALCAQQRPRRYVVIVLPRLTERWCGQIR